MVMRRHVVFSAFVASRCLQGGHRLNAGAGLVHEVHDPRTLIGLTGRYANVSPSWTVPSGSA
jgi:hypothetical protein